MFHSPSLIYLYCASSCFYSFSNLSPFSLPLPSSLSRHFSFCILISMLPSSVIIIMCCRDNSKAVRRERRKKRDERNSGCGFLGCASLIWPWAEPLIVRQISCAEKWSERLWERVRWWWLGRVVGKGKGGREWGGDGWRWKERRQKAAGRRSVLWSDRGKNWMAKERDRGVKMHREVEIGRHIHRPGDMGEKGRRGNEERGCVFETECDDKEHKRKVENEEKEKQMK